MDTNELASKYLEAFENGAEFPDGLSYRTALVQSTLDYSVASLDRIDYLLDQIRTRQKPNEDEFLADYANQSFLYLLAFYVGAVVSRSSGATIQWLNYNEVIERFPDQKNMLPLWFGTSMTCTLSGGRKGGLRGNFIPLSAICDRLFEAEPTKSVAFSAGMYM